MKRPGPTLRVLLRETGSALHIWFVPYMRLAGVCLSSTGSMASSTEGPERGVIETIILSVLWLQVRKLEGGSYFESPSAT